MVPIIGQPILGDWSFSVVVVCTCENRTPLLYTGKPGAIDHVACPACGKAYVVAEMPTLSSNGQIMVKLGQGFVTGGPNGR